MVYIYTLQLEQGKYYVGKTNNPEVRLNDHFNFSGSVWTQKYKPINVLEVVPNCNEFDEDRYTLTYMRKYGINNVRGGTFCELKLSDENLSIIKKMFDSSADRCYICGEAGHFTRDCKQDSAGIFSQCSESLSVSTFSTSGQRIDMFCSRCGRNNHTVQNCFAKSTIDGKYITYKSVTSFPNIHKQSNITCFRCGKNGHIASNCFAGSTVDGESLTDDESDDFDEESDDEYEFD